MTASPGPERGPAPGPERGPAPAPPARAPVGDLLPRDRRLHPPALTPGYRSTIARAPRLPLLALPTPLSEATGPVFGDGDLGPLDHDLTRNFARGGAPIGERILIHGRVLDGNGRPVPRTLVEIWQANAAGRYRHGNDDHPAPIDPNFGGCGRCLTGADGAFAFRTVKPGPYPWRNGPNTWRPAHVHFSVFGPSFAQRLITQMYFEGDPLIGHDAIVATIHDPRAAARLVAPLDLRAAVPHDCLAYRFDIVLRGRDATPPETSMEASR